MIPALSIVAVVIAALTWIVGWWAVPVVAAVAGVVLWQRRGSAWLIALGAVLAWSALILVDAVSPRFTVLSGRVGAILRLPAGALLTVTLLFAALLAWSAATLGVEIGRFSRRSAE
jgi:hypothetical protein